MNSFFEQSIAIKGGTSCIIGSTKNGVRWTALAESYLIKKMMSYSKYEKILYIALDRPHNLCLNGLSSDCKLEVLNYQINEMADVLSMISSVKAKMESCEGCGIVVSSFTEICLSVGHVKAMSALRSLIELEAAALILTVHSSLHSPAATAQISKACIATASFVPNDGILSDEVAGEIYTFRKSPTGRISESAELFGLQRFVPSCAVETNSLPAHELLYISRNKHKVDASALDNDDKATASTAGGADKDDGLPTGVGSVAHHAQRLIAFDSTDPEFDDDSDPDADLDL